MIKLPTIVKDTRSRIAAYRQIVSVLVCLTAQKSVGYSVDSNFSQRNHSQFHMTLVSWFTGTLFKDTTRS